MRDTAPGIEKVLSGRRIAVVHYGEGADPDPGHRPHRSGRLAASLVEMGNDVVRIVPSFRQWDGVQRPQSWTGTVGPEGRLVIIPTHSYASSRSRDRITSLTDFNRGVAQFFTEDPHFDLVVAGFPPPGLLKGIKQATSLAATIADIRDLWPDALVPDGRIGSLLRPTAASIGRSLANELQLADAVVAMSSTMLERAPANAKRTKLIPIGFPEPRPEDQLLWPEAGQPMTACFVGSMSHLFDLRSMLLGWQRFIQTRSEAGPTPQLVLVGDGVQRELVDQIAANDPTVTITGWVLGEEVAGYMHRADIGIAPTRMGHGTTISNKVAEYMAAGLVVLNTLNEEVGQPLTDMQLGYGIAGSATQWSDAFAHLEANTGEIRATRNARLALANEHFGNRHVDRLWFDLIADILATRSVLVQPDR